MLKNAFIFRKTRKISALDGFLREIYEQSVPI